MRRSGRVRARDSAAPGWAGQVRFWARVFAAPGWAGQVRVRTWVSAAPGWAGQVRVRFWARVSAAPGWAGQVRVRAWVSAVPGWAGQLRGDPSSARRPEIAPSAELACRTRAPLLAHEQQTTKQNSIIKENKHQNYE
jgi:hypothetical protein